MSRNKESLSAFFHDLVDNSPIQTQEQTRNEVKKDFSGFNSHEIAQKSRIQPNTAKEYKNTYKDFARYIRDNTSECRDERGIFRPTLLTQDHAMAYLEHRAENAARELEEERKDGISAGRMQNIISQISKIPAFMDGRDSRFSEMAENWRGFDDAIKEFRSSAFVKEISALPKETRAINNPQAVLNAIERVNTGAQASRSSLVAEIQLRTGLRVDNARCFTLKENGTVAFFSKGHMPHENYKLPSDLYARALAFNGGNMGRVELIPYRTYLNHLQKACAATKERYSGSHSWRHTYAKGRYDELLREGKTETQAKATVSEELFHKRLDIVNVYLR